jgi:hypothetical protein
VKRELTTQDLELAWQCVGAAARSYSMVTIENNLCHVLQVPLVMGPPWWKKVNIIACRGSDSLRDVVTDLEIGLVDLGIARVHAGFWKSANSILDQVLKLDQTALPAPVVLCGHSKGADEAKILAWQLARCGRPVAAVHTFGGPRIGDAGWRRTYNAQKANFDLQTLGDITTRWVHEEDIVARLLAWITGYRHVGHEAFMSSFGGVEMDPPLWAKGLSDLWGTFWGYERGHIELIEDHPVSRYVEHLKGLTEKNA